MITLAKDGMRTDLERIWRLCFREDDENRLRYFFDKRYNPNTCAVYIDEGIGRPVAMLHMLDASITEDSEIVPVQYIYAAATRPDYQKRGIMRQLMEFARIYASRKGQKYQILVPGSKELFRFYENRGFYRCFKVRDLYMSRSDLIAISDAAKFADKPDDKAQLLTLNDLFAVRRDVLVDREGFVTWDYQAVRFAAGMHENSGGSIITATDGFDAGYAFCTPRGDGTVEISEMITHSGFEAEILRRILRCYRKQTKFELRVPVCNEFFSSFGELTDYGMIAAVSGRKPINLLTLTGTHIPYLGLALD